MPAHEDREPRWWNAPRQAYRVVPFAADVRVRLPRSSQRVAYQALVPLSEPRKRGSMKLRDQHDAVQGLGRRSHVGNSRAVAIGGVVAAPFVIAAYAALTMMFILPLLGLRWLFPNRSMASIPPWYREIGRSSGDAGSLR